MKCWGLYKSLTPSNTNARLSKHQFSNSACQRLSFIYTTQERSLPAPSICPPDTQPFSTPAHTHIQHLRMPLPFQPTPCALSFCLFFSLSFSHVTKLLKHLPAVTSLALVPDTLQYKSLGDGWWKNGREWLSVLSALYLLLVQRQRLRVCPLALTADQTHAGLHHLADAEASETEIMTKKRECAPGETVREYKWRKIE